MISALREFHMRLTKLPIVILIAWGIAECVVVPARFCCLLQSVLQIVSVVERMSAGGDGNIVLDRISRIKLTTVARRLPSRIRLHMGLYYAAHIHWIDRDLAAGHGFD